jgi:hypothetical protein
VSDLTTLATPKVINDAMAAVQDPSLPVEDRAAMYGLLFEIQRRIHRALGTYARGKSTPKTELAAYLSELSDEQLGPLYLGWEPFDVEWPCNAADNWTDIGVQEEMALIAQVLPEYVKRVPEHLEINVSRLGEDTHAGDPAALQLWRQCKERSWRIEGGKRAVLKVREVKAPKKEAA